ncbi:zinc-binding dehydrogenase [Paenibacillus sp.]|jgi:threonine dehydrogenase-like Zn-dependent dehydrogenase|uniref:zinc-dependent alcohol dehydrogenase n=1 Tax=Paenibacillus sp. TaxID=58172 RepID=UPI002818FEE8|nr:zinc-binding dehydrogenase [Paenibacillus sp.]MDR0270826.1 zinc-binding dehydrogenase [Paenibacillus sp.]
MNMLSKHLIWKDTGFVVQEKEIQTRKRTVVKVISCGWCGTDTHNLNESNISNLSLGHETLAEIVHLGENHNVVGGSKLAVGDRVILIPGKSCGVCEHCTTHSAQGNLCDHRTAHGHSYFAQNEFFAAGGFSSNIELMDDVWLAKVPDSIPNEIAVLAEPLAVCIRAVDRAISGTRPDRDLGAVVAGRAAVIGLGPIGYLTSYVLLTMGFDVVGFEQSPWRCEFAEKELGIKAITLPINDHNKINEYNLKNSSTTDFDVVFECGGTVSAFVASLLVVRKGGRVIEMGNYFQHETAEIDPSWICKKEIEVIGFKFGNPFTYLKVFNLLNRNSTEALKNMTFEIKLSDLNKILTIDHQNLMKVVVTNDL